MTQPNLYPIELRELLSKTPRRDVVRRVPWDVMLHNLSFPAAREYEAAARQMADLIAHDVAGEVFARGLFQAREEPDEYVLKLTAYVLRYDQLLELLYQAYSMGQTRGRAGARSFKHDPA